MYETVGFFFVAFIFFFNLIFFKLYIIILKQNFEKIRYKNFPNFNATDSRTSMNPKNTLAHCSQIAKNK